MDVFVCVGAQIPPMAPPPQERSLSGRRGWQCAIKVTDSAPCFIAEPFFPRKLIGHSLMVLALFPLLGYRRKERRNWSFFAEKKQQRQPGSWWRGWRAGLVWLEAAVIPFSKGTVHLGADTHTGCLKWVKIYLISVRDIFPRLGYRFILLLPLWCCSITNQAEMMSWAIAWLEFSHQPWSVQRMCGCGSWGPVLVLRLWLDSVILEGFSSLSNSRILWLQRQVSLPWMMWLSLMCILTSPVILSASFLYIMSVSTAA